MSEGALFDPRDFVIADGIAHLCAGGAERLPASACHRIFPLFTGQEQQHGRPVRADT
jgi:hypothetical protein